MCFSRKQKAKHTDKILEVSSIFQCLLDEANRENTNSEFSLPKDFSEEFKRLQLAAENKISEAPLQTEGSYDTAAQCVNEDIEMKEFKLLHPIEENSTDDAELGLNEKTECKEEAKRKQSQQLEIFHEEYTDTSLTESTAVQFNMNSTSEMQVQVNYVLEEGDQANLVSQSFENNSCMSPPLFESQPDKCLTDTDADSKDADTESDTHSSPQVTLRGMKEGCRASPAGTAVLPENQEESGQTEGLSLEQTHIFQVCWSMVKSFILAR